MRYSLLLSAIPLLFSLSVRAAPGGGLNLAIQLDQAGASQLALKTVETGQPKTPGTDEWLAWEKLRLSLLVMLDRPQDILRLAAQLPPGLPGDFRREAWLAAARAAMKLGKGQEARTYAARLLWEGESFADHAMPRRLVLDSYLAERRAADAYLVYLRYQQDFPQADKAPLAKLAELLLDAGMATEAATWLPQLTEGPLKLMIRLETGLASPEAAIDEARGALQKKADVLYWGVLLRAARMREDLALAVEAQEQLLHAGNLPASGPFHADGQALWRDYLALAQAAANQAGLLTGDDQAWAELALQSLRDSPSSARALIAYLVHQGMEGERLLAGLAEKAPAAQGKELLSAMGDVAASHGQPEAAASYYLRAAFLAPPRDPFAQAARLKAAASLARAGLDEDARRQYRALLKAAKDPAQQEAIRRALEKLQ